MMTDEENEWRACARHSPNTLRLDIETEVHDVTVLHLVVLAFDIQFTSLTHGSLRTVLQVVVILDNLRSDIRITTASIWQDWKSSACSVLPSSF